MAIKHVENGIAVMRANVGGGGSSDAKSIIAVRETSPTTGDHAAGDFIYFDDTVYKLLVDISSSNPVELEEGVNITSTLGLEDGTIILTPEEAKALDASDIKYGDSDVDTALTELNSKFVYSSNEIRCGTWIDGKPLYKKTYTGGNTGTSANDNAYPYTINATERGLWVDAIIVLPGDIVISGNMCARLNDALYGTATFPDNTLHKIISNVTNTEYCNAPIIATLYYTKITD